MSSYVQHFSDGSVWWCLDDFFWPHEYGYIKLKWIEEWYSAEVSPDWKKRAIRGEEFRIQTQGLERVHEKPLSQKRAEAIERGKEVIILKKLREWVDKELKLQGYEHQQILEKIDLLTSLETPQFTPWQMIEVSFDGEKWWKREYVNYEPSLWYFWVSKYCTIYRAENWCLEEKWKFARPIKDKIDHDQVKENIRVMDEQDGKIEPEVPEFKSSGNTPWNLELTSMSRQIEALTTFCQALARQKTNK